MRHIRTLIIAIFSRLARKRTRRLTFAVLAIAGAAYAASAYVRDATRPDLGAIKAVAVAPDVILFDQHGVERGILKECREARAVVLVALGNDDAGSTTFVKEARGLVERFEGRGVRIFGVSGDPKATADSIQDSTGQGGSTAILLDPKHELLDDLGISRSLETVVLDEGGQLLARGALDGVPIALERALNGRETAGTFGSAFGPSLPEPSPLIDPQEDITFADQVAPIVWKRCVSCHRPGEVGPFSLLNYQSAAKRAFFLHEVVDQGRMPPSKAVPGFGAFLDQGRLPRRERAILARWAETGAREGETSRLVEPPRFVEGWQLGEPDLVVEMAQPYTVSAGGDDYQVFVVPSRLTRDQGIAAVEFRPGNRRIVHHARIFHDPTDSSRKRDLEDPAPGFDSCGGSDIRHDTLADWIPGAVPRAWPLGIGKIVKKGSDLLILIHYHADGKTEVDRSSVGLYFTKSAPTRTPAGIPLSTSKINIPPGEKRYQIALRAVLPSDVHAYSVLPHGHFLMKEIKLIATFPDGSVKRLLWIDDWDFNWQGQYHFARPVALPAGTILDVLATYDNSADNPSNPNHPPVRVRYGPNSTDEMLGCHLQVVADDARSHEILKRKWPLGF